MNKDNLTYLHVAIYMIISINLRAIRVIIVLLFSENAGNKLSLNQIYHINPLKTDELLCVMLHHEENFIETEVNN